MRNPLESLDELILNKVFEPITRYANKKLGWTKYDLEEAVHRADCGFAFGSGLYGIIAGYSSSSVFITGFGVVISSLAIFFASTGSSRIRSQEKREIETYLRSKSIMLAPEELIRGKKI